MSDGRIIIDTLINNKQADKQLLDLQRKAKSTTKEMEALNKTKAKAETAKGKLGKDLEQSKQAAAKTAAELDRVSAKLDAARQKSFALTKTLYATADPETLAKVSEERFRADNAGALAESDRLSAQLAKQDEAVQQATKAYEAQQAEVAKLADQHAELTARLAQEQAAADSAASAMQSTERVKGAFAGFGKALGNTSGKLLRTAKNASVFERAFERSGRTLRRFGGRLREILSGALLFNLISRGLHSVTADFGTALAQSEAFRTGMANLKGATAVAAAPLVQALAPALGAVANAAALALNYVAKLVAFFTGGSVKGFAAAAKSMNLFAGGAEKAKRSLAGFDQINQLADNSGGAGGTGDIAANFEFDGSSPLLESIKESIQNGDWKGVGDILAQKMNDTLTGSDSGAWGTKVGALFGAGILVVGGFLEAFDWSQFGSSFSLFSINFMLQLASAISAVDWSPVGQRMADGVASIDYAGISTALGMLFGAALSGALGFFGGLLGNACAWIKETFLAGWNEAMDNPDHYADTGAQIIVGLLKGVLGVMAGIASWIWDNVFVPFGNAIAEAFDMHSPSKKAEGWGENVILGLYNGVVTAISNKASAIKDSLVSAFKSAVNGVIDVVNRFIGWLNSALSFSWNGLSIGGKKIFAGGSVQLANLPTIPHLAQGAVIPPNREFLAVLGDQKRGTNIEAPLETIQQALANVLAAQGSGDVDVNITFTGDLAQLGRVLKPVIEKETKRRGTSLVKGDAPA